MKQMMFVALVVGLFASCGEGVLSSGDLASADRQDEVQPGVEYAAGELVSIEDPLHHFDVLADVDEEAEPIELEPEQDAENSKATRVDAIELPGEPPDPTLIGQKMIVTGYAALRKRPKARADTLNSIEPQGGVHDGSHGVMRRGILSQGQIVKLVDGTRRNGFYQVTYMGKTGWIHKNRIQRLDTEVHRVKFAMRKSVRNAFFKHQLRRARWNADGPYSSANCAPTSLAMAVRIFGLEGQGKSIEQSIHRVRLSYGDRSDRDGTFRSEIVQGARKLGLKLKELHDAGMSTNAKMDRLNTQLRQKRVVVLEGMPGAAYRSAITRANRVEGMPGYTFKGRHSILLVGRLDNGRYLVADPLSEVGMTPVTRAELKSFFYDSAINRSGWGGTGTSVWR